ncbi:MAG: hypothetical protein JXR73_07990 [Candidatus Omnitrophica bacterium]|nr:hypothetical protein [Candidatus Omnitrophota bacterium]
MNRKQTVPAILAVIWSVIIAWQVVEHTRFKEHARMALLNRARDITNSLATVIRSQRRFGGIVSKNRLESAMEDLIHMDELRSIALLNSFGEVVTSIGESMGSDLNKLPESGELWEEKTVTFLNLVDLGVDQQEYDSEEPRTLILTFPEPGPPGEGGPPPPPPERFRRDVKSGTDQISEEIFNLLGKFREEINSSTDHIRNAIDGFVRILRFEREIPSGTDSIRSASGQIAGNASRNPPGDERDQRRGDRGRGRRSPRFDRPFWMDQDQYQSLLEKQGLHGFIMVLSTHEYNTSLDKDIWMRSIIGAFSLLAMFGIWLAWQNLIKSSELQLRLVRASEMNAHLREMNVAAAGLAHETRNPLNIVRGYAQMISKQGDASTDIRTRSMKIIEEVDLITAQFNEFIDYSKPREPKRAPVVLNSVIRDVERALRSDLEDKEIDFQLSGPELTIHADESLLRQIIFNLLINSIQAVDQAGKIEIILKRSSALEACLEIQDNGPGVPKENQDKIFQPYFTTNEKGTGLGLAMVRQIVMSHGWSIDYMDAPRQGATFLISGMKTTPAASEQK